MKSLRLESDRMSDDPGPVSEIAQKYGRSTRAPSWAMTSQP